VLFELLPNVENLYPELYELIKSMLDSDTRPSIEVVKEKYEKIIESCEKLGRVTHELTSELRVKIGDQGKWKKKIVKLADSVLLVYDHKESLKAKLKYPIKNCKIRSYSYELKEEVEGMISHFSALPRLNKDAESNLEEMLKLKDIKINKNKGEIIIEHGILQTLYLKLEDPEGAHKEWYKSLQPSVNKNQ